MYGKLKCMTYQLLEVIKLSLIEMKCSQEPYLIILYTIATLFL